MKLPAARRVRELRGMTQPDLAEASGVSLKTIVNVEGEHSVRPTTARKLSQALDVSVAVLAGVEPFPLATAQPKALPLELEVLYVADAATRQRALEAASPEQRERYVTAIDQVVWDVMPGIREWDSVADDESKPPRERRVAREAREALWQHIDRLTALRAEAVGADDEPLEPEELAEFITAHAGVGDSA